MKNLETLLAEESAYIESDGETVVLSNELGVEIEVSAESFEAAQEAIAEGEDIAVDGVEFALENVGLELDMYVAPEGVGVVRGEAIGYVSDSFVSA